MVVFLQRIWAEAALEEAIWITGGCFESLSNFGGEWKRTFESHVGQLSLRPIAMANVS